MPPVPSARSGAVPSGPAGGSPPAVGSARRLRRGRLGVSVVVGVGLVARPRWSVVVGVSRRSSVVAARLGSGRRSGSRRTRSAASATSCVGALPRSRLRSSRLDRRAQLARPGRRPRSQPALRLVAVALVSAASDLVEGGDRSRSASSPGSRSSSSEPQDTSPERAARAERRARSGCASGRRKRVYERACSRISLDAIAIGPT